MCSGVGHLASNSLAVASVTGGASTNGIAACGTAIAGTAIVVSITVRTVSSVDTIVSITWLQSFSDAAWCIRLRLNLTQCEGWSLAVNLGTVLHHAIFKRPLDSNAVHNERVFCRRQLPALSEPYRRRGGRCRRLGV